MAATPILSSAAYDDALKIPHVEPGMSVGLFGGSFNPPHDGHRHVALTALQRLQLDRLWWLVSPGNPLKQNDGLPPLNQRLAQSRDLISHPRVDVTGCEATLETKYSADLVCHLVKRFPAVRFIWIMGADNLTNFHRWERWEDIAACVPICVIDRPGDTLATRSSRAAKKFGYARIDESDAKLLKNYKAPAWTFIHAPKMALSSTVLRQQQA
ncbi:MAG: nicotinate-nucleotide adenylyltransferase [Hyphomicrobiales bacterium]